MQLAFWERIRQFKKNLSRLEQWDEMDKKKQSVVFLEEKNEQHKFRMRENLTWL